MQVFGNQRTFAQIGLRETGRGSKKPDDRSGEDVLLKGLTRSAMIRDMTHEYEGRYRTKHAPRTEVDPSLANQLCSVAKDGTLPCSSAFIVSDKTGTSPTEVGQAADLLELKITKCQLGLFGYGKGRRNIVEAVEKVSDERGQALHKATVNGRLPCKRAWEIAERFGLPKMAITSACERLNIRLGSCQLGTF